MIFKSKTVVPFLHEPLIALEKTKVLDKYLITNRVSDKIQILQINHVLRESKPHCKERELQTPLCLSVTSALLRFPQSYTDPHNNGEIKLI